jgi:hypothetical protein
MMNDHSPDKEVMKKVATLQAMKSMGLVQTPEFDKRASKLRDTYFGMLDGRNAKRAKRPEVISDEDGTGPDCGDRSGSDSDTQTDGNGEAQGRGSKSSNRSGGRGGQHTTYALGQILNAFLLLYCCLTLVLNAFLLLDVSPQRCCLTLVLNAFLLLDVSPQRFLVA